MKNSNDRKLNFKFNLKILKIEKLPRVKSHNYVEGKKLRNSFRRQELLLH